MINVKLKFNPYVPLLEILINSVPISIYSKLKNYCNAEFETWSKDVFNALYEEINDFYVVEYVGQYIEYQILQLYAMQCVYCEKIMYSQPQISEAPLQRLRLLNNMALNGVASFPNKKNIYISIASTDEIFNQIKLPMLSYCFFRKSKISIDEGPLSSKNSINIFVCESLSECELMVKKIGDEAYYIVCNNDSSIMLINSQVVFCCSKTLINDSINAVMNVAIYPQILRDIIFQNQNVGVKDKTYSNLLCLDREIKVILPKELEVGVDTKLEVSGVDTVDRLQMRRTGIDFVSFRNGMLCAHDTGVACVEILDMYTNRVVARANISCIRKKHITNMRISPSKMVITVGENREYKLIAEPFDNDDMGELKMVSDDSFVAYAQDGVIYTRGEGICSISAICGNVSAQCIVDVRPRVTGINVDSTRIEMRVGQVKRISISQEPPEALPMQYTVNVQPKDVIYCDINSGMIQALKSGEAVIRIGVGTISKQIVVKVQPKEY